MKLYYFLMLFLLICSCQTKEENHFTYQVCNISNIDKERLYNDVACQDDITYKYGDTHYFKVKVYSAVDQHLILRLNNGVVKMLNLWIIDEHGKTKTLEYGWEPQYIPPNVSYGLCESFLIQAGQEVTIYCEIYDEYWPINQSIKLYSTKKYEEVYQVEHSIKIICRSLIFITMLLGVICAIYLKQRVFAVYVLCSILYVTYPEIEYGLLADYFGLQAAVYTKYVLLIVSSTYHYLALELYTHIIFQQKNYLGRFGKILQHSLLPIAVSHILLIFFSENQHVIEIQELIISFAFLYIALTDVGIIILLYLGIKEKRKMVYYALGIFSLTTMTIILFSVLPNANITEKGEVHRYIFHIIITFDMIAYLSLLFYQTYLFYKEKMELEKAQFEITQKYTSAFIDGQEKERQQIKAQLDQEVNSKLDHIHQSQNINSPSILSSISSTITKIREISHYLVSPDFTNENLHEVIEDLCYQKKYASAEIHLNIPPMDTNIDLLIKNQIYRIIQALLDLSIEYPLQQNIHISLLLEEGTIAIYFENDICIDSKNSKALQHLKNRVYTINGTIEINASELGTYIGIEGVRVV
ncbi:hypothetical protein [Flammeovirga sp. SJP92]|uniref:hypothetical protein n=1 Tax=Flammeovirga sp. SJP92 TaxID=1775430 RepID=UPI0007888F3C|nr:hypothetical protein [Flammeovirga sp. SJP92]KXX66575.1 hypothetical protein AVL50_31255 [Flammeovirga sp. SJP92]